MSRDDGRSLPWPARLALRRWVEPGRWHDVAGDLEELMRKRWDRRRRVVAWLALSVTGVAVAASLLFERLSAW